MASVVQIWQYLSQYGQIRTFVHQTFSNNSRKTTKQWYNISARSSFAIRNWTSIDYWSVYFIWDEEQFSLTIEFHLEHRLVSSGSPFLDRFDIHGVSHNRMVRQNLDSSIQNFFFLNKYFDFRPLSPCNMMHLFESQKIQVSNFSFHL